MVYMPAANSTDDHFAKTDICLPNRTYLFKVKLSNLAVHVVFLMRLKRNLLLSSFINIAVQSLPE